MFKIMVMKFTKNALFVLAIIILTANMIHADTIKVSTVEYMLKGAPHKVLQDRDSTRIVEIMNSARNRSLENKKKLAGVKGHHNPTPIVLIWEKNGKEEKIFFTYKLESLSKGYLLSEDEKNLAYEILLRYFTDDPSRKSAKSEDAHSIKN